MAPPKGYKHSAATKAKIAAAHRGRTHSEEWRAAQSRSLRGQKRKAQFERTCTCGVVFMTAAANARFHTRQCARAARGHGLINAPEFAHFERRCAICGTTENLVGDHDHRTGEPRGILCRNDNMGIGYMADDPARLRAAALYLEN